MRHQLHLKQGFRLNRTVGFSLLLYSVLLLFPAMVASQLETLTFWFWFKLGALGLLGVGFLLSNEAGFRTMKRYPQLDSLTLEKLSLLLPVSAFCVTAFSYVFSGQIAILLLGTVVLLQCRLLGHSSLARSMAILFVLMALTTLPLGYPILFGLDPLAQALPSGLQWAAALIPLAWCMNHTGSVFSSVVRNTTSKVSQLQSLAATDGLTGLMNRRQFNYQLELEIARSIRYKNPLSLALFDIDDFKKINDLYGHQTGDRILKELGAMIRENVRDSDIPARYGGEEFALVLPETSQMDAYELLERLRMLVEQTVFCMPDNPMTITISIGISQLLSTHAKSSKSYTLIEQADTALYDAKRKGKNQVVYGKVLTPKVKVPSPELH